MRRLQQSSTSCLLNGLAEPPSVSYRVEFVTRAGILIAGGRVDVRELLENLRRLEVRHAARASSLADIEEVLDGLAYAAEGRMAVDVDDVADAALGAALASWIKTDAASRRDGIALLKQEPDAIFNVVLSATHSELSFCDWPDDDEALREPSRTAIEFLAIDYGPVGGRA